MKHVWVILVLTLPAAAQNSSDVLKQGEQVFASSCATGYCHGTKGGPVARRGSPPGGSTKCISTAL